LTFWPLFWHKSLVDGAHHMSQRNSLKQVFRGMLSSQSFELLRNFSDDSTWEDLLPEERELLAQLFLLSAENGRSQGEARARVLNAYQTAVRLLPASAKVWYRLGSFLSLQEDEQCLEDAVQSLQKAVAIDGGFFDAHYALASAELRLGSIRKDSALLSAADRSFHRGLQQCHGKIAPELYWHWGIVWYLLGKESGEASDFMQATTYFEKALQAGLKRSDFFNDYGNALVEVAVLVSRPSLISEAISHYRASLDLFDPCVHSDKDRGLWFFNIASCHSYLLDTNFTEETFLSAEAAFSEAAVLYPEIPSLWYKWSQLQFRAAQHKLSYELAESAIELLRKGEQFVCGGPLVAAFSAQIYLWLGTQQERYDLLRTAGEEAERAVALQEEQKTSYPDPYVSLALYRYSIGRYFDEKEHVEKAAEIVERALFANQNCEQLWHLYGLIKAHLGKKSGSEQDLKEACVCYVLASKSPIVNFPSFWNEWGLLLLTLAEITEDGDAAEEAIEKFEIGLQLTNHEDHQILYHMALAADLLGDISEEEEFYEHAIGILVEIVVQDPTFSQALFQLGASFLHLGELRGNEEEFAQAAIIFEQYLETHSDDAYAWIDYALSLIRLGMKQTSENIPQAWFEAEDALRRSLALGNDLGYYHLASLYALMGNLTEGMEALNTSWKRGVLPDPHAIQEDRWLESLVDTAPFRHFIDRVIQHKERNRFDIE